jgi:hypothetical protein
VPLPEQDAGQDAQDDRLEGTRTREKTQGSEKRKVANAERSRDQSSQNLDLRLLSKHSHQNQNKSTLS